MAPVTRKLIAFVNFLYPDVKNESGAIYLKKISNDVKLAYRAFGIDIVPRTELIRIQKSSTDDNITDILEKTASLKLKNCDIYVIFNKIDFCDVHASSKFIHVCKPNVTLICHGIGHLLGLSHTNGNDPYSFMGTGDRIILNAPQMNQINKTLETHVNNSTGVENIYSIKNFINVGNKMPIAVIVPVKDKYNLWVSYYSSGTTSTYLLHFVNGNTTTLIKEIDTQSSKDRSPFIEIAVNLVLDTIAEKIIETAIENVAESMVESAIDAYNNQETIAQDASNEPFLKSLKKEVPIKLIIRKISVDNTRSAVGITVN